MNSYNTALGIQTECLFHQQENNHFMCIECQEDYERVVNDIIVIVINLITRDQDKNSIRFGRNILLRLNRDFLSQRVKEQIALLQ